MSAVNDVRWLSATEAGKMCGVSSAAIHYWRIKNIFKRVLERKSPTGRVSYEFPADEVERLAKESKPVVVGA